MIVKIPRAHIARMKMLYNPKRKTLDQLHTEYGFDYAINTVLFDLDTGKLAGCLTVDGQVLCSAANPYGYAVEGGRIEFSYNNVVGLSDFAGCAYTVLVRGGNNQAGAVSAQYGQRQRSAVGLTADSLVLLCDQSPRSLNAIAEDLVDAGCETAVNYDGGSSSQMWTPGTVLRSARTVPALLAVWLKEAAPTDEKTEESKKMKILLISGHGAGDPGVVAGAYREADETRAMTNLLAQALAGVCDVTIYPTDRNAYDDYKKGTLAAVAGFPTYDYVLEVHFNAFQAGASDGKTKGVECYVTTAEAGVGVEEAICREVSALGLANRGVKRKNWSVIQTAKTAGISSALLEVCFLDDADDMAVYTKDKAAVAAAIARGICEGFGLDIPAQAAPAPWYADAQAWAMEMGIADGSRPTDPAIHAEVWTMLHRMSQRM